MWKYKNSPKYKPYFFFLSFLRQKSYFNCILILEKPLKLLFNNPIIFLSWYKKVKKRYLSTTLSFVDFRSRIIFLLCEKKKDYKPLNNLLKTNEQVKITKTSPPWRPFSFPFKDKKVISQYQFTINYIYDNNERLTSYYKYIYIYFTYVNYIFWILSMKK